MFVSTYVIFNNLTHPFRYLTLCDTIHNPFLCLNSFFLSISFLSRAVSLCLSQPLSLQFLLSIPRFPTCFSILALLLLIPFSLPTIFHSPLPFSISPPSFFLVFLFLPRFLVTFLTFTHNLFLPPKPMPFHLLNSLLSSFVRLTLSYPPPSSYVSSVLPIPFSVQTFPLSLSFLPSSLPPLFVHLALPPSSSFPSYLLPLYPPLSPFYLSSSLISLFLFAPILILSLSFLLFQCLAPHSSISPPFLSLFPPIHSPPPRP